MTTKVSRKTLLRKWPSINGLPQDRFLSSLDLSISWRLRAKSSFIFVNSPLKSSTFKSSPKTLNIVSLTCTKLHTFTNAYQKYFVYHGSWSSKITFFQLYYRNWFELWWVLSLLFEEKNTKNSSSYSQKFGIF